MLDCYNYFYALLAFCANIWPIQCCCCSETCARGKEVKWKRAGTNSKGHFLKFWKVFGHVRGIKGKFHSLVVSTNDSSLIVSLTFITFITISFSIY